MIDTSKQQIHKFISSHTELSMPKEQMSMILEYFEAMGNFYQLIPLKKVYEILTVYYKENVNEKEFYELTDALHNDPIGFYYIDSHDEVYNHLNTSSPQDRQIVHESIVEVDIDIYEKIRELKQNKPYYIPEKEELLKYFDDMYYEETEPLKNMRRFFIRRFPQNHKTALDIVDDIALCIGNEDYSIDDSLDTVQRFGYNMSLDETKEFVPYFEELRNNFRMPANNGFTPLETEVIFKERGINGNSLLVKDIKIDDKHEAQRRKNGLEESASLDILSYAFKMKLEENGIKLPALKNPATVKIGRNDPCPCGSGKKYKKCCGR